jgi:SAM-dependent methyltransferase
VHSDGVRCDLPDASIDVVVSHSVLEHVHDLHAVLGDINRMLKPKGHAYLTVAPLYYSPTGLHRKNEIRNWEHLDPNHPSYLASTPFYHVRQAGAVDMSGSPLNKMTAGDFLAAVGGQPWNVRSFTRMMTSQPIPEWVDVERFGRLNILTKGFVFVGRKIA